MKHKKQMLAGFLALALSCGAGCAAVPADKSEDTVPVVQPLAAVSVSRSFSDVADSAWYAEAVDWCAANDILSGTAATVFSPQAAATRITVADALYRAAGRPAVSGGSPFSDVETGSAYANAAVWVSDNHVMSVYGGGVFGANDSVTREDLATNFWRYSG